MGFAQHCARLLEVAAEMRLRARRLAWLWTLDAETIAYAFGMLHKTRNRTEGFRQSMIRFSYLRAACCLCRAKATESVRKS